VSDTKVTPITDVLARLHKKMPALNYPQYELMLRKEGIAYANAVGKFEKEFFINDIGMATSGNEHISYFVLIWAYFDLF
jgi:hypothetical protein